MFFFVGTTTYFIYTKVLVRLAEKGRAMMSGEIDYSKATDLPTEESLTQSSDPNLMDDESSEPVENEAAVSETSNFGAENSSSNTGAASDSNKSGPPVLRWKLMTIASESGFFAGAELKDAQVGIIPDISKAMERANSDEYSSLLQTLKDEEWKIDPSVTVDVVKDIDLRGGGGESTNLFGLVTQVQYRPSSGESITVSPEVTAFLAEGTPQQLRPTQESLPLSEYSIPKNGALFIFGLIPHRRPSEAERLSLPTMLVNLMENESFLERITDLFIVIEFAN
jgi:hypothetical protein